jgi:hypothetical protein
LSFIKAHAPSKPPAATASRVVVPSIYPAKGRGEGNSSISSPESLIPSRP